LDLRVTIDLHSGSGVGWPMRYAQNQQIAVRAVLMALWQKNDHSPVIFQSNYGSRSTSSE